MVDLKKEIKLSDLIPKLPAQEARTPVSAAATKRRADAAGDRRAEDRGRRADCGRTCVNNGAAEAAARRRRRPCHRASSAAARCATRPGSRPRSTSSSRRTTCRAAASGSASPTRASASACRDRRHRRPRPARERDRLPRPRGPLDPARRGASSTTACSRARRRRRRRHVPRILLVAAYRELGRPLPGGVPRGRDRARRDRPRGLRAPARDLPRRRAGRPSRQRRRSVAIVGHDRTTLAVSDGTVCQFTRVLEWGTANIDTALCRALKITSEQAAEIRTVSRSRARRPVRGRQPRHRAGAGGRRAPRASGARARARLVDPLLPARRKVPCRCAAWSSRARSSTSRGSSTGSRPISAIPVTAADPFVRIDARRRTSSARRSRAASSSPSDSGSRTNDESRQPAASGPTGTVTAAPVAAAPRKTLLIACGVLGVVVVAGLSTAVLVVDQLDQHQEEAARGAAGADRLDPDSRRLLAAPTRRPAPRRSRGSSTNRMVWDGFLNTLSKVTPEDVWLQNLQVATAGAAAAVAQRQAAAAASAAAARAAVANAAGKPRPRSPPRPPPHRAADEHGEPTSSRSAASRTRTTSVARMMRASTSSRGSPT